MAVEAPAWMIYLIDFLVFILFVIGVLVIVAYRTYRKAQGMMIAEIWEPSGYPVRRLAKWDITGKTVEVDGGNYVLKTELTEEEREKIKKEGGNVYPSRRFTGYGFWPFRVILRIESWEKGNPNPIRPWAEKPEVTSAELTSIKNEIQAVTLGMEIQEAQERQKQLTSAIANQPSKMVVYVGLGLIALMCFISLIMVIQLAGVA